MPCITNGDSAAANMKRAGVPGVALPWRDVLHEGPVPSGLSFGELREVRGRFIGNQGWGDFDAVMDDFVRRDQELAGFRNHEEVVLLFEHDLYDQLQLIQLLDWFEQQDLAATRLTMVRTEEYLGALSSDRLFALFLDRHEVSTQELSLGREAWRAFRSSDPTEISALVRKGAPALPFLEAALQNHLEQFPSTTNGLSRTETRALGVISEGRNVLREAFVASQEEPVFLGDAVFAVYLERLSQGNNPLVLLDDGKRISAPRGSADGSAFWNSRAVVTETGYEVLEGREDWVELNGIDRWLGGVHLSGSESRWRWNDSARRLQHCGA